MFDINLMIVIGLGVVASAALCLKIVPQKHAWVLERFGHYRTTLVSGVNVVLPLIDRIAYKYDLQETSLDIPNQICFTRARTQLQIDSVLYFQIIDPVNVSYRLNNYLAVITQLAHTTLRSVIGKCELNEISETSNLIDHSVTNALIGATADWGLKIVRYEVTNLTVSKESSDTVQSLTPTEQVKPALTSTSEGKQQEHMNFPVGTQEAVVQK